MITSLRQMPLVLACLASASATAEVLPGSAGAPDRIAPAASCLDARDVQQLEQSSPDAIAVRDGRGQAFRIAFSAACPAVNEGRQVRLDAPQGWACGQPGEQVVVDGRHCAIRAVTPIDTRAFSQVARESSAQYAATLPTVTVTGKADARGTRRHTFQGTPEFCFAARHVRSWNEDPKGVVVETNPRRSGGHRYYRLELAGSCTILAGGHTVEFQSGFQNGLICGNPGDRIVVGSSGIEGDQRAGTPRFARPGCDVLAVYPQ